MRKAQTSLKAGLNMGKTLYAFQYKLISDKEMGKLFLKNQ